MKEDNDGQRQEEYKQAITDVFIEDVLQVYICDPHILPFLVP